MTDTPLITTNAAAIDTVQVAIHCVRIGAKQMTQAVFRQLPCTAFCRGYGMRGKDNQEYELHFDPGTTPWGLVNYFWPGCDDEAYSLFYDASFTPGHAHLLFVRQDVLYRDCVLYPGALEGVVFRRQHGPDAKFHTHDHLWAQLWRQYWEEHIDPLPQLFIAV